MNFTTEQIEKAKKCKTLEELKELSVKEGLSLTDEKLKECFSLTRMGELNDDDLDKVAGGTKYSSGVDGPHGVQKYVIVTLFNKVSDDCMKYGLRPIHVDDENAYPVFCKDCKKRFTVIGTSYCSERWEGNDPINK